MISLLRFAPLIAGAAAVAALALYCVIVRAERDSARATVADLTQALAQAQEIQRVTEQARQVAEAHAKRAAVEAARWGELVAELEAMEGGDAPLSDYLARAARRLWE